MTEAEIAAEVAMRTAIIGVVGAFIVALVGIGGTLLNVKLNADRERERLLHEEEVRRREGAEAAARQILRHIEQVAKLNRSSDDETGMTKRPIAEVEPHVFAIQGLAEEVYDKKARDIVLEVADSGRVRWSARSSG